MDMAEDDMTAAETTRQQVDRFRACAVAYDAAAEALRSLAQEHPVAAKALDWQAGSFERSAANNRAMLNRRLSGR